MFNPQALLEHEHAAAASQAMVLDTAARLYREADVKFAAAGMAFRCLRLFRGRELLGEARGLSKAADLLFTIAKGL